MLFFTYVEYSFERGILMTSFIDICSYNTQVLMKALVLQDLFLKTDVKTLLDDSIQTRMFFTCWKITLVYEEMSKICHQNE